MQLWDERPKRCRQAVLTIVSDCCYVPKMQQLLKGMRSKDKRVCSMVLLRCPGTKEDLLEGHVAAAVRYVKRVEEDWWRSNGDISDLVPP